MGGCTPTGFKAIRNTIGSGKNKTSITHLEPVTDEKEMVQQIFKTFRQCNKFRLYKCAFFIFQSFLVSFIIRHYSMNGIKFFQSAEWIETQELLEAIADKYNRPHRATNALLLA